MRCHLCNAIISETVHGRASHYKQKHPDVVMPQFKERYKVPMTETDTYLIEKAKRKQLREFRKGRQGA